MENGKKKLSQMLTGLVPVSDDVNINYRFAPLSDNSIMKLSWNSPNDGKGNLINFLLSPEPYTIRIKDNH